MGCIGDYESGEQNVIAGSSWNNAIALMVCPPDLGFLGPMLEGILESVTLGPQLELPHDVLLVLVAIWLSGLTRRRAHPQILRQCWYIQCCDTLLDRYGRDHHW